MPQFLSESDLELLNRIRSGERAGWDQLVYQFQGRLLAFSRKRLAQSADAEDAVQEAFLSFVKSLPSFRGEASLETWLFQLVRRRIADIHRRRGRSTDHAEAIPDSQPVAADQSASWYVRRSEQQANDSAGLLEAVLAATNRLKEQRRFRDLKAFDLLFFAHWKNQNIAAELGFEESAVAVLKHRFIQRIADRIPPADTDEHDEDSSSDLLSEVWQSGRPSCPKRSTLGKYILGTLSADWDDFLSFHIERLGCEYCAANLDDLSAEINATAAAPDDSLRNRILESTVGFLNLQNNG